MKTIIQPCYTILLFLIANTFICQPLQAYSSGPSAAQIAQRQRDAAATAVNDQGIVAFKSQDYATAEGDFKQSLGYSPNNPVFLRNLAGAQNHEGLDAYNKGDYKTALNYFQQALGNDPVTDQERHFITEDISAAQNEIGVVQQDKIAANNIQQSVQGMVKTLNAAPASGGLDFNDGKSKTTANAGNSSKN